MNWFRTGYTMTQLGKTIIVFGILLILIGTVISFGNDIPVLKKLGRLPGDIILKRGNFTLYVPWVTCLLISLVMYVVLNIFRR